MSKKKGKYRQNYKEKSAIEQGDIPNNYEYKTFDEAESYLMRHIIASLVVKELGALKEVLGDHIALDNNFKWIQLYKDELEKRVIENGYTDVVMGNRELMDKIIRALRYEIMVIVKKEFFEKGSETE